MGHRSPVWSIRFGVPAGAPTTTPGEPAAAIQELRVALATSPWLLLKRAATPTTCGVAMEVPLMVLVPPLSQLEVMSTPGGVDLDAGADVAEVGVGVGAVRGGDRGDVGGAGGGEGAGVGAVGVARGDSGEDPAVGHAGGCVVDRLVVAAAEGHVGDR